MTPRRGLFFGANGIWGMPTRTMEGQKMTICYENVRHEICRNEAVRYQTNNRLVNLGPDSRKENNNRWTKRTHNLRVLLPWTNSRLLRLRRSGESWKRYTLNFIEIDIRIIQRILARLVQSCVVGGLCRGIRQLFSAFV